MAVSSRARRSAVANAERSSPDCVGVGVDVGVGILFTRSTPNIARAALNAADNQVIQYTCFTREWTYFKTYCNNRRTTKPLAGSGHSLNQRGYFC